MSKKVANASAQPVAIRLVKRAGASIGFSDGIKPAGAVDDAVELSFNLGGYSVDDGRFVIGCATTPNIKNPLTYADLGDEFTFTTESDRELAINADLVTNDADPNYSELQFGIFFRLRQVDGLYVMASPTPSHSVVNYKNQRNPVTKTAIKNSVGQWFNDDHYYIPLYLGTLKELLTNWQRTTAMGIPEMKTLGPLSVLNRIDYAVEVPVESVTIDNVGDLLIGEYIDITTTILPAQAEVVSIEYNVDNPAIARFNLGTNRLVAYGMGKVKVTVTVTDSIGNLIRTSKDFNSVPNYAPMSARYVVDNTFLTFIPEWEGLPGGYVDWGDGTIEQLSTILSHSYVGQGTRYVKLWFDNPINSLTFGEGDALREIQSWGDKSIGSVILAHNTELVTVPSHAPLGITKCADMFNGCSKFNQNLNGWNVADVTDFTGMFEDCTLFNGLIDSWDVSSGESFTGMFRNAVSFNRSINNWNLLVGWNFDSMFEGASSYNQPINQWNLTVQAGRSTSLRNMFKGAVTFNQSIVGLINSAVRYVDGMLFGCSSFNQPLNLVQFGPSLSFNDFLRDAVSFNSVVGSLNGTVITSASRMFQGASAFNQPLASIDFSECENAASFLEGCAVFNRPLNDLDVGNLKIATAMFKGCTAFTSDLSDWEVGNLTSASEMFMGTANFDSDLQWWCVQGIASEPTNFATGSFLARSNYPVWGTCPVRDVVVTIEDLRPFLVMGASGTLTYSTNKPITVTGVVWESSNTDAVVINATTGEYAVVGLGAATITCTVNALYSATHDYTVITEVAPAQFVVFGGLLPIDIDVDITSTRNSDVYVEWGDGHYSRINAGRRGTHIYDTVGEYTIKVLPIQANGCSLIVTGNEIRDITQFGESDIVITSAMLVNVPATIPTNITKLKFKNCPIFNSPAVLTWDVSVLTDLSSMFQGCLAFNQPIGSWDVSNATTMSWMLGTDTGAMAFNQDLSGWETSLVTDTSGMFRNATTFNQPIGSWSMGVNSNMSGMFQGASAFNQDLKWWCVNLLDEKPTDFDTGSALDTGNLPIWGTCPVRTAVLTITGAPATVIKGAVVNLGLTLKDGASDLPIDKVVWSIDNTSIASISQTGVLTTTDTGPIIISVVVNDVYTDTANTTSVAPQIIITGPEELAIGQTAQLTVEFIPDFTPESVEWNTDNELNGTVSPTGLITGVGEGTAIYTILVNGEFAQSKSVSIFEPVQSMSGMTAGTEFKLVSEDELVVVVDGDVVNPVQGDGTYTYTKALTGEVPFTIDDPTRRSWFDTKFESGVGVVTNWYGRGMRSGSVITLGKDITSVPTTLPANVDTLNGMFTGSVNFDSANVSNWDTSAITDFRGMFEGATAFAQPLSTWDVSAGTNFDAMFKDTEYLDLFDLSQWCTTISGEPADFIGNATTPNHYPVWGTCPPRSATVTITSISAMNVGDDVTLEYTIDPTFTPGNVVWSTSDAAKATVSAAGVVHGVAAGTVTITLTINSTFTDTLDVVVQ